MEPAIAPSRFGPRLPLGPGGLTPLRALEIALDGRPVPRQDHLRLRRPAARLRPAQSAGLRQAALLFLRGLAAGGQEVALLQRLQVARRQRLLLELRSRLGSLVAKSQLGGAGALVHAA